MKSEQLAVGSGAQTNIAIFASGAGTNAQKIIEYFTSTLLHPSTGSGEKGDKKNDFIEPHYKVNIALIVCNKANAGVLQIAANNNISSLLIEKETFFNGDGYLPQLKHQKIDYIILAGFLWKMPTLLTSSFPKKIINIHPALLPNYGGKGMYGHFVHEAVIAAKETQSGITIHFVDEIYDHGEIIFQATCVITNNDTAQTLAAKVTALEHLHYPKIIAGILPKHS